MLGRKYVFETKSTRMRRLFISGAITSVAVFALLATFIFYIPIYAKMHKEKSDGAFFQKSPDAIAVFTGDKGRIAYAMELLKKNPTAKLFISGVYSANSFQTILNKHVASEETEELASPDMQVDLDYESKNTFENVRETVEYLKSNPELKRVLIISSDYHIMRINLIFSHFIKNPKQEFYYDSVPTDYTSWKEARKLLLESLKITRTFIQLKILREERFKAD